MDIFLLFTAALVAGFLNAIAGGGSFVTFPSLVFTGVPVLSANATNAVSVFPGYMTTAWTFRNEILKFGKGGVIFFVGLSVLGGAFGAFVLLSTSARIFQAVVPWLLLFATLLFAFEGRIAQFLRRKQPASVPQKITATLAVTAYGGYFNGGVGIIIIALFSLLGYRDLRAMIGLKSLMTSVLTLSSVATYSLAGLVYWHLAAFMMAGTVLGGYGGSLIVQRLPKPIIRMIVITFGFLLTLAFLWRGYA